MLDQAVVRLKVWSDFACFTRPEFKVERMSFPVCTPSAARGVLDAILFKKMTDPETGRMVPAFHWHIRRITVLRLRYQPERPPYEFVNFRRNEIKDKISPVSVRQWMNNPATSRPYKTDTGGYTAVGGDHRIQRHSLVLRDVAYLLEASVDQRGCPPGEPLVKYREMFLRRARKGQCFHRPYLGCREFAAQFSLIEPGQIDAQHEAADWNESLGLVLYDLQYLSEGRKLPGFFQARVRHGVMHCDTDAPAPWGDPPITVHGWEVLPWREGRI